MDTIAVITDKFLYSGRGYIYDEIKGIKNYNVQVLTEERYNEQEYPYENVYLCKNRKNVIQEFSNIIESKNIKLIHVQFGTSALHYLPLKRITGLPYIVSFQGYDASIELKNPVTVSRYQKELFPQADHLITVSQKLKDNLVSVGCPDNKLTVLWNGIDTTNFYYKPRRLVQNEPVIILCVARLVEKKGLSYLIDVFANIQKIRPNTRLLIIGEGNLKESLLKKINDLKLQQKAAIQDWITYDQIPSIMHQCHIFCLPSITSSKGDEEGTPNVLKEAQATGMPVVATNHSGIMHVIQNGKNGFLVDEKNIVQLTEKLLYLIDHPESWEPMGEWGRKYIEENFDKFKQAQKLEILYRSFIRKTGR